MKKRIQHQLREGPCIKRLVRSITPFKPQTGTRGFVARNTTGVKHKKGGSLISPTPSNPSIGGCTGRTTKSKSRTEDKIGKKSELRNELQGGDPWYLRSTNRI